MKNIVKTGNVRVHLGHRKTARVNPPPRRLNTNGNVSETRKLHWADDESL